jgi:hypothetical protein
LIFIGKVDLGIGRAKLEPTAMMMDKAVS